MAFNSSVATVEQVQEFKPVGRRMPVDLNHLHNQTFGDRGLQREVLRLFVKHSAELLDRLQSTESVTERRELAHNLVGSAKGIGAFSVAYIAAEIEMARGPVNGRMKALATATETARSFIIDLLAP